MLQIHWHAAHIAEYRERERETECSRFAVLRLLLLLNSVHKLLWLSFCPLQCSCLLLMAFWMDAYSFPCTILDHCSVIQSPTIKYVILQRTDCFVFAAVCLVFVSQCESGQFRHAFYSTASRRVHLLPV